MKMKNMPIGGRWSLLYAGIAFLILLLVLRVAVIWLFIDGVPLLDVLNDRFGVGKYQYYAGITPLVIGYLYYRFRM